MYTWIPSNIRPKEHTLYVSVTHERNDDTSFSVDTVKGKTLIQLPDRSLVLSKKPIDNATVVRLPIGDSPTAGLQLCVVSDVGGLRDSPFVGDCLCSGTLVGTANGLWPINILVGNESGWHKEKVKLTQGEVDRMFVSKPKRKWVVTFSNGLTLRGSESHRLETDKGYVKFSDLKAGMKSTFYPNKLREDLAYFGNCEFLGVRSPRQYLDTTLAEFLGFLVAAGRIDSRGNIVVQFRKVEYRDYGYKLAKELFKTKFFKNEFEKRSNVPLIKANDEDLVEFFHSIGLKKSLDKKVMPTLLCFSPERVVRAFMRSFVLSRHEKDGEDIVFPLYAEKMREQLAVILANCGLNPKVESVVASSLHAQRRFTHLLRVRADLLNKWIGGTSLPKEEMIVTVSSVKKEKRREVMYDLHVPEDHWYTANGFRVHNSGYDIRRGLVSKNAKEVIRELSSSVRAARALDVPGNVKATLRNAEVFSKNKGTLRIISIVHGKTHEERQEWIDKVVASHRFHHWGADGLLQSTFDIASTFLYLAEHTAAPKRFYVFDGMSASRTLAMAWLGKYEDITGSFDIASHKSPMFLTVFGNLKDVPKGSMPEPVPCNCPICKMVGWSNVYFLDCANTLRMWHNAFNMQWYAEYWGNVAAKSTLREYLRWISLAIKKEGQSVGIRKSAIMSLKELLKYITLTHKNGFDQTRKQFRGHFVTTENNLSLSSYFIGGKKESVQNYPQEAIKKMAAVGG